MVLHVHRIKQLTVDAQCMEADIILKPTAEM
jgi:hypothetical protein